MTDEPRQRPSLKDFDAYTDRNGQTEAEMPAGNIRAIGDASRKAEPPSEATKDSIDRATASVGSDEES